ncbi:alpha/beta fold hydrolase [Roseomonas sp. SSH11]|uniref:Alpha/beta fold hydrolase n=1 Tax=Pararoseomonas baculiformis TaxID=2820812 RepID=A0ABS4A9W3_9PROT|nr:alpha/beta fold hydrolase [Pararoseomonas baculiformis]MBP0443782.1 alpha/beta fold hydrolase [Pararoseomonas baculiformis]
MTRTPLLFLPGLLCDERLWRDQVAGLAGLARPVVADLTRDDAVVAMAARAVRAMDEAGAGRFAMAGLSMGGYVALEVMRQVPGRVERLALFDTSARPDTPEQSRQRRGLMSLTRSGQFRGVTPRLLPRLLHATNQDGPLAREVMDMAERVGRDAFLRQQAAILGRPDSRGDLSGIAVPSLVAVGEADILTPPELAREIAEGIPGAVLRIIPGCAHLPSMEAPEVVNAILRDWLGGASSTGS